jgi:mannose-6-phosphate isomerase-like protein (cupin superfamily)
MKEIEYVNFKDQTLAVILRAHYRNDGVKFFTPNDFSQQLGYMKHSKGHVILPHVHNSLPREVQYTKEVLFIKSGKIRVDFYEENKNYLESRIINSGDFLLLAFGGHGFEMLEPTEMIEIKQGPYAGETDKTRFKPIDKDKIKIKN